MGQVRDIKWVGAFNCYQGGSPYYNPDYLRLSASNDSVNWVNLTQLGYYDMPDYSGVTNMSYLGCRMVNLTITEAASPPIVYTLNVSNETSPIDNYNSTLNYINFWAMANVSLSNSNSSLYLNSTLNQTNASIGIGQNINVSFFQNLSDGMYNYNFRFQDNGTNLNTPIRTFKVNNATPVMTSNLEGNTTLASSYLALQINTSDIFLTSFYMNSSCGFNYQNSSITTGSFNLNTAFSLSSCNLGVITINATAYDSSGLSVRKDWQFTNTPSYNFTAKDIFTAAAINTFSIFKNGVLDGSTTTGNYQMLGITNGSSYNVSIYAPGYAINETTISVTNSSNIYNFDLYTTNSIQIFIKDESTGLNITSNVSILFSSIVGEFTNYTSNARLYVDNLNITTYTLTFNAPSYTERIYSVVVGNASTQTLTAYLAANTSLTTFTITDKDTSLFLENASATMYRTIGGLWTPVESHYSDITGRVQFQYLPNVNYKFYISKSGYNDNIFFLNPILFSSYDIPLTKTTLITSVADFDGVSIIYAPSVFNNNEVTLFSMIFQSPTGLLTEYGFNLTYPNGGGLAYNSSMDVNAIGSQLYSTLNITNATSFDTVKLNYYYITSLSGQRNFTSFLTIASNETSNSFHNINSNTYGMTTFERLLIATIIVILVVGIATLVGQPISGLALGLLIFGYLVYIGFIPIWSILITMFIGFIFLTWKSGGY